MTGRRLSYAAYLDKVLGGWIGKSAGGAIGARFEGNKNWIELERDRMFPEKMPPNDDLDLQVLWLKVLEEKGADLDSDDLAEAWLEWCWYPFNEYGVFRRNWTLGVHPPYSGSLANRFWETGMGCPIRAEIWGYVFPGAPGLAARYAEKDGCLDHTEQSVGGERMLAAMASMAFFEPDLMSLAEDSLGFLPRGSNIDRLVRTALRAKEDGLSLRQARDRIMVRGGVPEACDSQVNVPFIILGLLYGGDDIVAVMLDALKCGYDTDCTLASAAALHGQVTGAARVPDSVKGPVGDELVMGIKYRRPEMSITALARDTARIGILLARELDTGFEIEGAPDLVPLPPRTRKPRIDVHYGGLPCAAPGEKVALVIETDGPKVALEAPAGWKVEQSGGGAPKTRFTLTAPGGGEWPMLNTFTAKAGGGKCRFGVVGADVWRLLGVCYDAVPEPGDRVGGSRAMNHHFVSLQKAYLPEPGLDADALFREMSGRLGEPALVFSREMEIDPFHLVGLKGPCCAYLVRDVISPSARDAWLVAGNSDPFRVWLNGSLVGEMDECVEWAPFNNAWRVKLNAGPNRLLVKLLRRGEGFRFTIGFRGVTRDWGHNCEDWLTDLASIVP